MRPHFGSCLILFSQQRTHHWNRIESNQIYFFFLLPSLTSTSATGLPPPFLSLSEPSLHVERRRARNIQPTSNQLTQLVSVAFFLVFYLPPLFSVLLVCRLFFSCFRCWITALEVGIGRNRLTFSTHLAILIALYLALVVAAMPETCQKIQST